MVYPLLDSNTYTCDVKPDMRPSPFNYYSYRCHFYYVPRPQGRASWSNSSTGSSRTPAVSSEGSPRPRRPPVTTPNAQPLKTTSTSTKRCINPKIISPPPHRHAGMMVITSSLSCYLPLKLHLGDKIGNNKELRFFICPKTTFFNCSDFINLLCFATCVCSLSFAGQYLASRLGTCWKKKPRSIKYYGKTHVHIQWTYKWTHASVLYSVRLNVSMHFNLLFYHFTRQPIKKAYSILFWGFLSPIHNVPCILSNNQEL